MEAMVRNSPRVRPPIQPALALGIVALALLQACALGREPARQSELPSGTPAPTFSLTDQFGHEEQLSDFRGRVVLLTFIDSRCTTICPLTAELMTKVEQAVG